MSVDSVRHHRRCHLAYTTVVLPLVVNVKDVFGAGAAAGATGDALVVFVVVVGKVGPGVVAPSSDGGSLLLLFFFFNVEILLAGSGLGACKSG